MPHICWVEKQIFSDQCNKTDELCFTLSINKSSVMTNIEVFGYFKFCPPPRQCHRQLIEAHKETMIAVTTDLCTNTKLYVRASCQGIKPGSTILNPNPSTNQRIAPYKKSKEEFKSVLTVGKKHGWDMNGVILMNFLPRGTTKNSDHYTETLCTPNDYLCSLSHKKNI